MSGSRTATAAGASVKDLQRTPAEQLQQKTKFTNSCAKTDVFPLLRNIWRRRVTHQPVRCYLYHDQVESTK